jgi:DedD protein
VAYGPVDAPVTRPTYILGTVDTHLKERLVGAAVLVAAAVILIPEMLSGPSARSPEPAERSTEEDGVKTYTIDLGARARSGASEAATAEDATPVSETAPPPLQAAADPGEQPVPSVPETAPAVPEPAAPAPESAPAVRPVTGTAPAQVANNSPSIPPGEAAPARVTGNRGLPWVVQVGSFAKQETADKLGQELKRRGYAGFVVPFKNGTQTLYRVRVGPMQERSEAESVMQKLKREGTAATVVAN